MISNLGKTHYNLKHTFQKKNKYPGPAKGNGAALQLADNVIWFFIN
jgi:hypothetical protein